MDRGQVRPRERQIADLLAYIEKLPDVSSVKARKGAAIYEARCEPCHGPYGRPWPAAFLPRGVQRPPRLLWWNELTAKLSEQQILAAAQHGRGAMPAIPRIQGQEEASDLLAYLRLMSSGMEIYAMQCAPCHGTDGHPPIVTGRGLPGPAVVFDRAYLDRIDEDQLRRRVWHMLEVPGARMPHFQGDLTDAQVREILAYLRKQP